MVFQVTFQNSRNYKPGAQSDSPLGCLEASPHTEPPPLSLGQAQQSRQLGARAHILRHQVSVYEGSGQTRDLRNWHLSVRCRSVGALETALEFKGMESGGVENQVLGSGTAQLEPGVQV